jgi:hypothetical protein
MVASAGLPVPDGPRRVPTPRTGAPQRHRAQGLGPPRIGELAAAVHPASAGDRETLADQLTLVMEGVYASVQALGVTGPAHRARAFAEALLSAAR